MIAMGKRREERQKEKKTKNIVDCTLGGTASPNITSLQDLSIDTIQTLLFRNRYAQVLVLLTFIGLVLRLYNLGFNSIWLDEASTYGIAKGSFLEIWQVTAGGEFNPPLFHWAEHGMLVFGTGEFVLRFIPALLGVLTIPVMYWVASEFLDRNAGIIAAALMTFSPFHIFYSQEARAYTMMLFFVALALLFYLKALKTDSTLTWVVFGVCSALAFWSHFYSFVIIAALIMYTLTVRAGTIAKNVRALLPLAFGVIAFIVACFPLMLVTVRLFITRTSSAPTFGIQGIGIIGETLRQISGFSDIPFYTLLCLFALGCVALLVLDRNKAVFLISILVFSFVISFVLSFKMPMIPRYMIFLLPVYFVGIAASYRLMYRVIQTPAVVYGLMALSILVSTPMLVSYYSGLSKDDWRGFAGRVGSVTHHGDMVVLVPGYMSQPLNYYYSNATDGTFESGAYTGDELSALYAGKGNSTMYLVVTNDIAAANPKGDAVAWLQNHTQQIVQQDGIFLLVAQ